MAVSHGQIRDLLLPGLREVSRATPAMWANLFVEEAEASPAVPMIGVGAALALGAAAVVVQNPVVTRRWFAGWFS
jgi:hypothetical protein